MTHFWNVAATVVGGLLVAVAACVAGYRSLRRSEEPAKLAFKWIVTVAVVGGGVALLRSVPVGWWPVLVLLPAIVVGLMWAPSIGAMAASPLTGLFDGGNQEVEPEPLYSIAETKRRKGLYAEAAEEVRRQLEKFPGDLTGTLLLGAILAEDLHDLPGTRQLIEQWLQGTHLTPQGAASALSSLADWELQIGRDPEAAGACLQRIVQAYPGTPLSHLAQQRIAHLPGLEQWRAAAENADVDLPPGEKDIGLRSGFTLHAAADDAATPEALAQSYVEQLQRYPADVETREKLALLYAEHFQRLDLASDQLEQLIALPSETAKHIVGWLNLLATLRVKIGNDVPGAEWALRRIIDRFPHSASASLAFERLGGLNGELRATQKTAVKTLGQYEKNLGLKPRKG